ncbi:MAG TPA: pantetheine-phosphate adenylyltransferase [Bacteroidia bacterium]|nr:pantetheine-phosphate adenylyltransferase [Bacteroidia bacterium]
MQRIAVFPGSFDPITLGHVDIVTRGLKIFDKIIIGIGNNAEKKYMFSVKERENWLKKTFQNESKIEVQIYQGLTVDFCKKMDAGFILRGLRNAADFEFEKAIAHMNAGLSSGIETIFVLSELKYGALSSSIVRDIIRNGGDASQFLPDHVKPVK